MPTSIRSIAALLMLLPITASSAAAQRTAADGAAAASVEAIQERILADPQLVNRVHALSDNPRLREVLADPSVADALNRGDFGALLANPKVHGLADDPAIQGLTREIIPPE